MDLSVEQIRIINSKTTGHSLIKGVAGSGKTTVALFKLIDLQRRNLLRDEKILVVTYNKTLIEYMEYLCQEYGVVVDNKKVEIRTIDSIIFSLLPEKSYEIITFQKQRDLMKLAIQKVRDRYPNNSVICEKNIQFLLEEIDWIKSCRYLKKEEYLNIDRLGRNSIGENHFRLAKQSENREAIFDVFLKYENLLMENNLTDYKSKALRALLKIRSGELNPKKYGCIIVDESQDLSRVQLELIREMYEESDHSNIFFITDVAQSIYTQSWLSKQSFKSIGFDMSGKSNILSKNYRTTKQIALAAYSLINHDVDLKASNDYVEPELLERDGLKPRYRNFRDEENEFSYITEEIKKCATRYELKDIVVVARNKGYLEKLKTYFVSHGVDAVLSKELEYGKKKSFCVDKVKLFTLHSIKGLEAPVVFIAGINEKIIPFSQERIDVERKLLYVGMTRAKQLLYLTSSGQESIFIGEIEQKYLQLSNCEKENYYEVSIEDYHFFDQIKKVDSEEESVRQWYLELLQTRYGYPLQYIKVEAHVKCGSKLFHVDIAVYEDNKQEMPLIYVETKKPGEDLLDALKQVKCYMVPGNAAKYIVATDGCRQIIEEYKDGKYMKCEDIPFFDEEGQRGEIFEYYDLVHHKSFKYLQAGDGENCLKNVDGDTKMEYTYLPIKGNIAAGNLKYVNVAYGEEQIIPLEAVRESNMKFILQVSGDSMIDFNILDGDKIVVKKQTFAPEGSIIVGGNRIMNEATVKQFHCDGEENVILHPGNKKYSDIVIRMEDFYINGVVIGVIRKSEILW